MARSLLRRRLKQIDRAKILSAEERARLLLDERTERLATRTDFQAPPTQTEPLRVLVCGAGRERFGIAVEAVVAVLPYRECMPVPDGPPALVGVFGRGGHLVSVIDLAVALGVEAAPPESDSRHLVLLRRETPRVALRVDRAHEVAAIAPPAGEETGAFRSDAVVGYANVPSGAGEERLLSLLDVDRLLRPFLPPSPVPGV